MDNKKIEEQEEILNKRKDILLKGQKRIQGYYYLCLALGIIFISMGLGQLCTYILFDTEYIFVIFGVVMPKSLSLILLIYGIVMVVALAPMTRTRLRSVEEEIKDIEFERDLLRFEAKPEESRAEKLLRMSQYQLRRYYDLNLGQNYWIFVVGILCILLGVGIIGVTLYLLTSPDSPAATLELKEKVVLGFLGAVGTVLTDYIAAIYLKMHSAAVESLTNLHSKLVSTNKLFLANLIASRINDEEKRWDTFAKLSLSILECKE
jgi:MFS family permease